MKVGEHREGGTQVGMKTQAVYRSIKSNGGTKSEFHAHTHEHGHRPQRRDEKESSVNMADDRPLRDKTIPTECEA